MTLKITLTGLALAVLVFSWANWRQRRDRNRAPGDVSLIPLTLIQMVALVAGLTLSAHLISLLTGLPFRGRFS